MNSSLCRLQRLHRGERGATAVEYGLMVSLIAIVIFAAVLAFGREVGRLFELIPESVWEAWRN